MITPRKKLTLAAGLWFSVQVIVQAAEPTFIGPKNQIDTIASTIPKNGDVNPYGVAVVPNSTGKLVKGHILVSNFNNSQNHQGTGTTIVDISREGDVKLFAQIDANHLPGACPGGVGLTTALAVLRSGWVIVGSLPTSDGTSSTAMAGCLIVLNREGVPVETISGGMINGPWDMTALDLDDVAVLFVTNVLNNTVAGNGQTVSQGSIIRIVLTVPDDGANDVPHAVFQTVIGSGFGERTDVNALVIGPTGVGLGEGGILYVADTLANRVAAIPKALTRTSTADTGITVSQGNAINGPLGLAIARNGNILVANGGDGNMVEITPSGQQLAVKTVDVTGGGAGDLFGLAVVNSGVFFVNDGNNMLYRLH